MKLKTASFVFFCATTMLFTAGNVAAQLYRCTTDSGTIVYSDRKCASAAQQTMVKITDNSMDNSNLANAAAIRASLDSAMAAQGGGGRVAVIGNGSAAASSSSSAPPVRRRCGG